MKEADKRGVKNIGIYLFIDDNHTKFMETKLDELFWKFSSDMVAISKYVSTKNNPIPIDEVLNKLYLFKELK
ncbi:hypothetical protein SRABI84_05375 [Peribacillus simplex]|nr:hypothetical protein SRABI84_05375 [Peribacillus simplex]